DSLIEAGILPEEVEDQPSKEPLPWRELARDVLHLHRVGAQLPRGPLARTAHERSCARRLGPAGPSTPTAARRKMRGQPSVADLCLVLADLGGPKKAKAATVRHANRRGAAAKPRRASASTLDARRAAGAHSAASKAVTGTSTRAHGRSEPGTVRARR